MQPGQILLHIANTPITLLDVMVAGGGLAMVLLLLAVVLAWRAQGARRGETIAAMRRTADLEYRLAELSGTLRGFAEQSQGTQMHLARTLDERLDQVSQRLGVSLNDQSQRTTQSLSHLNERLAVIDSAQKNLAALSGEMITLKDILSNKQARGAYGQGRMEAIVRDGLHSSAYSFQSSLSSGTRPDCLIKLPDSDLRLVIDAKFPLEAFNALKAARGEPEVKAAEARLRSDVQKHVKDIS